MIECELGIKLSLGWKGHVVRFHLINFLRLKKMPLGIFSEQCSESVHKNMKYTLGRYKNHREKLEKAVASYSSMRV